MISASPFNDDALKILRLKKIEKSEAYKNKDNAPTHYE